MKWSLSALMPYGLAVASTVAAAFMTAALWPADRAFVFTFYYLAVLATAFYGHRRAAALAMVLSILSTNYSFVEPYGAFAMTIDGATMLVFAVIGAIPIVLMEGLKSKERRLRESEDLFATAFHGNPVAMAISRLSDGQCVEMNDTFGALIGYTREQVIGRTASELGLVTAEERAQYVVALRNQGWFRNHLSLLQSRARGPRHVMVSGGQISVHGQPLFVGIFNDVSESHKAEEALRRSEQQLRLVMEKLPVGAYTCDGDGRITYFNPCAERLWGRTPRLGDPADRFCGSGTRLSEDGTTAPHDQCLMALTLTDGQSRRGEAIIERPDGTHVTVLEYADSLAGTSGEASGAINVFVDITDRKRTEETFREQAVLLDHALRIGRMGSWTLNLRTGRLAWPEATCHLFGITAAQFDGTFEQFRGFILPEDVPVYDAANARVSASDPLFEAEYRIRRPDGVVRWMYSRGRVDLDPKGRPIGRAGIVMDITEQRAGRERLAQAAALLRTAGRVARLGGWTLELPSRVLTWSDENCAIHDVPAGYSPTFEEGVGYFPPESREEVLRHVAACETDGKPYDFELPKMTATGRRIWVRSIGEAVRDAEGKIIRLQGAFQDITDRRVAQEALRDSEDQFRTLAESMPQMVWIARPDGCTTYFNQQWVSYTGLSLADSYGDDWMAPFHPDDQQRAKDAWAEALTGAEYKVECRLRRADGAYRWMLVHGLPFRDHTGQITKWICTCTDIDEITQAHLAAKVTERVQRDLAGQLETERARLVAAQAVARVGSWETDLATGTVIWSAETYRIFETTPGRFRPTHPGFLAAIHPEDRAGVDASFIESLERIAPGDIEHRLLMPDGRIKFVEERWRVVVGDSGRPERAIGTCQDVTERHQSDVALHMQAHMLDHIGQAVIATDTGGTITYANRFAGELYGWDPVEMTGRMIAEVTVPHPTRSQALEIEGKLRRGESWSGEFIVEHRDGRVFPALVTDSPVLDRSGQLIGIVGISIDVSARRQAEEEIRQRDALIRIAGRITHTGGWALELPDQRVFWSDEVFDILDFPIGAVPLLAKALGVYVEPDREKVRAALDMCARSGTPFDVEAEVLTTGGVRKWVRVCGEAERRANGSIQRVHGAFQDITERKRLEHQYLRAQRMESIGTLAGGIAHDLNNVLTPIMLSTSLLQDDERDEGRLETLATIEASARRGAEMVSHVLSFARGIEGRRIEVQLKLLVREVAKIVRDTFPKDIRIAERVAPDLWPLEADPTQIHQILTNLCVNARDAMPDGGSITIAAENVRFGEHDAAGNIDAEVGPYVKVEVTDTGTGIPKEIIDQIFDPFFTTKEVGKGTGLGLATSLAIVKGHGGFIRAYSDPGAGTRICLFLPAQTALSPTAAAPTAAERQSGHGETVLVVDDEGFIRRLAKRTLEAHGYRVLLAADGVEATALYQEHQSEISVVLTDMMMPIMGGAATIQELVRMNPDVRIIGASGLAGDQQVTAVGGVNYQLVSKPYSVETLLLAIKTALAKTPAPHL